MEKHAIIKLGNIHCHSPKLFRAKYHKQFFETTSLAAEQLKVMEDPICPSVELHSEIIQT